MENKFLSVATALAGLIVGALLALHFGAQGSGFNVSCTNGGATGGSGGSSAGGSGGLGGSGAGGAGGQPIFGATATGTTATVLTGASLTAATTTFSSNSPGLQVSPDNHFVGVNTSTNPTGSLLVSSGIPSVSSTVAIGSNFDSPGQRGIVCLWNGTNYQKLWIAAPGAGFSSSTSATCP